MYFEEITAKQYQTLDIVEKKAREQALPRFTEATMKVFNSYSETAQTPKSLSQHCYYRVSRQTLEKSIERVEHSKKRKILSLFVLAVTVAIVAAVIIPLAIFFPVFLVFAIPLGIAALGYTGGFVGATFKTYQDDLQRNTENVEGMQGEVDELKEFMDSEGAKLKAALKSTLELLEPTNEKELQEKIDIEKALYNLRLAEQFVAELAQAEAVN